MLATPPSTPTTYARTFLPLIPSPLSPRRNHYSPYAHQRQTTTTTAASTPRTLPSSPLSYTSASTPETMTFQPQDHQHSRETPAPPRTTIPFSQRAIKTAPTTATTRPDALRERRRDMFLKKVKKEREDRRWGGRVEDMAQLDYRLEKSRWEAEQLRSAPLMPSEPVDDDESEWYAASTSGNTDSFAAPSGQVQGSEPWTRGPRSGPGQGGEDWEADALLAQEERELEAMIAMMEGQEMEHGGQEEGNAHERSEWDMEAPLETHAQTQTPYASDDDEYDSIFLDLIDHHAGQTAGAEGDFDEGEDMDMS